MATSNASSKYNYISCKKLIKDGSPAVWQLKPKKNEIGNLTKMTLGEKNPNKKNKTILLVGETGTGKSTLINTLVNYTIGVKWEDDVWFQIVEDEKKEQFESQTSDVIVYEIFGFEGSVLPFSLTIIDTPGFGDTKGLEMDEAINKRLFDLFCSEDGVHEIDAVGLVLKAGLNRLSDRLSYIFNSVVSLFGKDLERNIVALITHSPGGTPTNALKALEAANIKCARNEKGQPVHFLFNNSQNDTREDDTDDLEYSYTKAMKGMHQFTAFLKKTAPQNLEKTMSVHKEQIRLEACIHNLKDRIESIPHKLKEIQQIQEGLMKNEQEMKNNKEFTVEYDEHYKDKESVYSRTWGWGMFFEGAVSCTVCEETCHFPGCTTAKKPYWCEVMKGNYCTVCTGKCIYEHHVKENWRYVNKTRRVKKNLQSVKDKYEKNRTETEKKMGILEIFQKQNETLEANKTHWLNGAYECFIKLEQIALNVVSVSTYDHLKFLIGELEKKKEGEKVKKLKEMSLKKAEGFLAGLQYSKTIKGKNQKV
ncbi:uncharacterized protein LOC117740372 [Cyclopterus lumpus]|uniref:Zgc:172065 n=1 Tax=Cyclopterus lumpus TaxID=8103 RepID=A0A8C2Z877_CYCLU|nr:uncharacterized protein LOC117740372 [Cyclopterus lumpus]